MERSAVGVALGVGGNIKIFSSNLHDLQKSSCRPQGPGSGPRTHPPASNAAVNAHTLNAQYLTNERAYELQTWYTDGGRRPGSSTSAVTSKVKGKGRKVTDASDMCWPISRGRNVLETPKLVGRLKASRTIIHTTFKVKDQGHQAD